jgi:hypothetical protein
LAGYGDGGDAGDSAGSDGALLLGSMNDNWGSVEAGRRGPVVGLSCVFVDILCGSIEAEDHCCDKGELRKLLL